MELSVGWDSLGARLAIREHGLARQWESQPACLAQGDSSSHDR
jgi:hypothetical protein